jgi:hypothetical protein
MKITTWSQVGCGVQTGSVGVAQIHQRCCNILPGWRARNKLRLVDMVPMLDDRTKVPLKRRGQVLETLHSAHQGLLGMGLRAEQSMCWPGFWSDIGETRSKCSTCQKIAPSQAKLPPMMTLVPNYPFEHICVKYMSLNGHQFRCSWTGTPAGLGLS